MKYFIHIRIRTKVQYLELFFQVFENKQAKTTTIGMLKESRTIIHTFA